ncbi:MAG: hypothetical protein ACFE94_19225 [Candidatus Hodarchaeota archaeon]
MKKGILPRILIPILISSLFLSAFYYITIIRIENLDNTNTNFNNEEYHFDELINLDTSYEIFSIDLFDKSLFIESSSVFENLFEKYDETFFFICFTGIFFSFELLVFFEDVPQNETSGKCHSQEVEGVYLTKEEMGVFNLIQEFLSYNRVFNKEKVAMYITSRYRLNGNLNYNGIKTVIDSLIKKNIIVEGSKLTRMTILLNENRRQIFNTVKENPGIYKNNLSKRLNLSLFIINWHLSMLVKFNLIREHLINSHLSYFEFSMSTKNDELYHIISREKCKSIIELLKDNKEGITKYQVSKALHMHYDTITNYLKKLRECNLLVRKKTDKKDLFLLNIPYFERIIMRQLE